MSGKETDREERCSAERVRQTDVRLLLAAERHLLTVHNRYSGAAMHWHGAEGKCGEGVTRLARTTVRQ